jgi:hypothetical protein
MFFWPDGGMWGEPVKGGGRGQPGGCPRPSGFAGRDWNRKLIRIFAKKCKAIFISL